MSMTKQDFSALADAIKAHNSEPDEVAPDEFNPEHLETLADFCAAQNPAFNRARWIGYIKGENGPNGGSIGPVNGSKLSRRGNPEPVERENFSVAFLRP